MLNGKVVFAIPLKPRSRSKDWGLVEHNLSVTLRSVRQSTNCNYMCAIAGHDRPDVDYRDDAVFLPVDFPEPTGLPEAGRDKYRKLRHIGAWVRSVGADEKTLVMFLDADDLISSRLVDFALSTTADALVVRDGYRLDLSNGRIGAIDGDFHMRCGSSFFVRFQEEDFPLSWKDNQTYFGQMHGHMSRFEVASAAGKRVEAVPFRAVTYLINHADSLQLERGRTKKVSKRSLVDAGDTIAAEFGFKVASRGSSVGGERT